jgi:monoamine oxidase
LTDYTGGGAAAAFAPSAPYTFASDPKTRNTLKPFLPSSAVSFPAIGPSWSSKAILSAPFLDSNLLLSYSYWRVGQYTSIAGYEGVAQGSIHFAGEHCSVDFQGLRGRRSGGGSSRGRRSLSCADRENRLAQADDRSPAATARPIFRVVFGCGSFRP